MRSALLLVVVLFASLTVGSIVPDAEVIRAHSNEYCDNCTRIYSDVIDFFGSNSSMSEVEKVLDLLCLLLPPKDVKTCRSLVKNIVLDLENLDKKLAEDYSPNQFCSILGFCQTYCCATPYDPQEIHISVNSDPTIMNVMWVTQVLTNTPTVQYGLQSGTYTMSTTGTSRTYTKGGWNGYIYLVTLTNLTPGTKYYYRVGDPDWEWALVEYNFITAPATVSPSDEFKFITYGDMGSSNADVPNLYWLSQEAYNHEADIILHIGDISYADGYQPGWDLFFQKVEPVAAQIPYMVTAGNHEEFFDFTAYRYRFEMPVSVSNLVDVDRSNMTLYYSFNYGNVHVIAISAESYWGRAPDLHPGKAQYEWLAADLAKVNRQLQPWVVAYLHRPLYCTNSVTKRCVTQANYYRSLIEDLLYENNVDLVLTGHNHNYERTLPVYNETVQGPWTPTTTTFTNPTAPIYAVVGTGGNHEGLDTGYTSPPPSWSAPSSRLAKWGFAKFVTNSTHLSWNFHSAQNNAVLDSFTIVKS